MQIEPPDGVEGAAAQGHVRGHPGEEYAVAARSKRHRGRAGIPVPGGEGRLLRVEVDVAAAEVAFCDIQTIGRDDAERESDLRGGGRGWRRSVRSVGTSTELFEGSERLSEKAACHCRLRG